jgi:KipI family sensor histidine kinase inhibitor
MPDPVPARSPALSPVAPTFEPTFEPIGDAALLVSFGPAVDAAAARAQAVATTIDQLRPGMPAIGRPVPAHASVLVPFDPLAIALEDAIGLARSAVASADATLASGATNADADGSPDVGHAATSSIEIPVRYGGVDGPDLDTVAELLGLRPADVVELHAAARYRVLFLGFAPGFGYLGGLPAALATPRRDSPRERIPAGTVAIAGEQTCVYPLAMPGGWQLIGRTDTILFDPGRPEPALLRPGASVRFVPVGR